MSNFVCFKCARDKTRYPKGFCEECVEGTILQKIKIGEKFYPSSIANKYDLDLEAVVNVMSKLEAKGVITENINNSLFVI